MGTQLPLLQKGHSFPKFRPTSVAAKQLDGSCGREVGLGPGYIVLVVDPVPSEVAQQPHVLAYAHCGQAATWIKMPLGTELGLCAGDIVLNGDPVPLQRSTAQPPNFRPMSIVAKRLDGSRIKKPIGTEIGLGLGHIRWGPSSPTERCAAALPFAVFGRDKSRSMSIVAKRSPISATAEH